MYRALEKVIPDIRQRVTLEMIGTPLTHARFLRRYQGIYGSAIAAETAMFVAIPPFLDYTASAIAPCQA